MSVHRVPVWTWRDAVRKAAIPPLTKLVCWAISNYLADVGEGCFPSIETLVADTGLSKPSVIKHVQSAIAHGLLTATPRRGQDGRIQRTVYHPQFPEYAVLPSAPASASGANEVNAVNPDKPGQGALPGSPEDATAQVNAVNPDSPGQGALPGPGQSQRPHQVNDVYHNYPLEPSTSPPTPQGAEREGDDRTLFSDQTADRSGKPDPHPIDGWAGRWTAAAQSEIGLLFDNPIAAHVAGDFLARLVGVLCPPAHVDAVAYVRQVKNRLQPFAPAVLRAIADKLIETQHRDMPATAKLVELATVEARRQEALAARDQVAAAAATPVRHVIRRDTVQWAPWIDELNARGLADAAQRAHAAGAIVVTAKLPRAGAELIAIGEGL
ncbi:helix-turn-helix domain-containing protein [Filomicrobium sp.]|uniref:helix-turn-helix domain-containing protein n=1 Tax=Filomicrobium sp. TaxID=2024831 RepID=UPI002586DAA9|nr:helix-turn-helix domain-containing protein [Filomicrobium sp.]MCV0371108.1 helix-turn-helix domain-containing protein [Filomicrobium sp.]